MVIIPIPPFPSQRWLGCIWISKVYCIFSRFENEPQHRVWSQQLGRSSMGECFSEILWFLNSSKECSVFLVCIQPRWICNRYFWRRFAAQWPVLFFSKTQRFGDLILKHIFVTQICIHRSGFFSGPSVWVTTNQRTYKSEPVMARARWEKKAKE